MTEEVNQKEYLAQTKLDEAVYDLIAQGWSADDIADKVYGLAEQYDEEGNEDE
jgi:hypothetical protein